MQQRGKQQDVTHLCQIDDRHFFCIYAHLQTSLAYTPVGQDNNSGLALAPSQVRWAHHFPLAHVCIEYLKKTQILWSSNDRSVTISKRNQSSEQSVNIMDKWDHIIVARELKSGSGCNNMLLAYYTLTEQYREINIYITNAYIQIVLIMRF